MIIYLAASLFLACIIAFVFFGLGSSNKKSNDVIRAHFKLDGQFSVVGTDLGKRNDRMTLANRDLIGSADVVFINKKQRTLVIGEKKSRKYRGTIKRYERYQVLLYMMLAKQRFRGYEVLGRIAYADAVVDVEYTEAVVQSVLKKIPELRMVQRGL